MTIRLLKALIIGPISGLAIWFVSQVGMTISFFTFQICCGVIIAPIFYVLAFWPNIILFAL
jgi:hypothetical protein